MIIVPVKPFALAKQRLAAVLSPAQRAALARAMLCDVLAALSRVTGTTPVVVVTHDPEAARLATSAGFEVLDDRERPNLNAAIDMASAWARAHGAGSTLVLPADLPLLRPGDIEALLSCQSGDGTVLVAARDGGTNALFRRPATLFPVRFGPDSLAAHIAQALIAGLPLTVLSLPGIGLDIDRPDDLLALANSDVQSTARDLARRVVSDSRRPSAGTSASVPGSGGA